jgi:hypothetical protein
MSKNGKLPKRIAGVKIPKELRKRGGEIAVLLNNPLVADIVAAGLLLAADRIAKKPKVKKAGRAAKHAAEDTAEAAGAGAVNVASVLAFAAREGARAIKANAGR